MTNLLAVVALLGLRALGAVTGNMSGLTAVVACGGAAFTATSGGRIASNGGGLGFSGRAGGARSSSRVAGCTGCARGTCNFLTFTSGLASTTVAVAPLD